MSGKVYGRPSSLNDKVFTYCPGCGHGTVHRILAEVIDEMGLREDAIGVCYVGCAGMIYEFFNIDWNFPLHGRAPAVATGIKRVRPDKFVFTYQGDGDLAAIGTTEIIHAASRGENLTALFINNGIYGMTGGQMAPTTLIGQVTVTTPSGRDPNYHGRPIRISEMIAQLEGCCFVARTAVDSPKNINATKKALMKAAQNQLDKKGFSLLEILSPCPIGWHMTPVEARRRVAEEILPVYPLGTFKDI
jgi:2-oxoglutarate ferredoxin oxidoreductase subunit beta